MRKTVIVFLFISVLIVILFFMKRSNEIEMKNSIESISSIYRKQIFYTAIGNHYDNLKSCEYGCAINNSYKNIFKIIETFKIIENTNKDDFEDVFHDYLILLYEFYEHLEINNFDLKKEVIKNEINKFLKERRFVSQIKVDYEITSIDSLEKYILDFRHVFPRSK